MTNTQATITATVPVGPEQMGHTAHAGDTVRVLSITRDGQYARIAKGNDHGYVHRSYLVVK